MIARISFWGRSEGIPTETLIRGVILHGVNSGEGSKFLVMSLWKRN